MDAESLFLEFRTKREPAALGAVFDLVADDLFAVALHIARDHGEAEDLLQETFLVALERAHRYDASRPLRQWLLGILHREAKVRRRRARRRPDATRLVRRAEEPPVQSALAAETVNAVAGAIASLPQPYRDVLELRLVQSLPHGEIAARLSRSPGAVRTQLWRGLELLRALLPKGLAVALAAHVSSEPGLAAVRRRVVDAAAAQVGVAGGGVLAGALLMKKIAVVVAAIAVVAVGGWLAWPKPMVDAPVHASAVSSPDAASLPMEQPSDVAPPLLAERTAIPVRSAAIEAPARAARATSQLARVLVVDGDGEPVPDADVELFEPGPKLEGQRDKPARARLAAPPFARTRTDNSGRAGFTLDHECFVAARKDGVGVTGDLRVAPGMLQLQEEWRLVLRPAHHIHGVVLLPDGSPAVGAAIRCWHTSSLYPHLAGDLAPVQADAEGKFELEVLPGLDHALRATLGEQRSDLKEVDTSSGGTDHAVTMRLRGAYSVRGVLLDADGNPTAGEVRLLCLRSDPNPESESRDRSTKADDRGRFELLLSEGGSYELVGGVAGQAPDHVTIVLDEVRPHQEAILRLSPFVVIAGRAVDEGGRPCPGVFVSPSPLVERTRLQSCCSDLQGIMPRGPTSADGSFRFLVPAGCRYRIGYRPAPELWASGPDVTPPIEDAVLVVRAADQRGFTVTGRVVHAESGAPVATFRVYLVTHEAHGFGDRCIAHGEGGAFAIGPLPIDARYTLRFEAEGLADAEAGPFDASVREESITARMPALGSLVCKVLREDGTPAVQAHVGAERSGTHPFERAHQGETDRDGILRLSGLTPDSYTVYASAASGSNAKADGTVRPGEETFVELKLQR